MQDIHNVSIQGPNASNIRTLCMIPTVDTAPMTMALKNALQNCHQTNQYFDDLQKHRAHVVEARMEALEQRTKELQNKKDLLQTEITTRMKQIETDYITKLKTIVNNSNNTTTDTPSTTTETTE